LAKIYRVHEFAKVAGVTVKALHHYDRLGLLKPARTGSGYRLYSDSDLERLEEIVALKFLGIPLKRIKLLLSGRPPLKLSDALQLQRKAFEEKGALIARAIRVIDAIEPGLKTGELADPVLLKRIIEVFEVHSEIELKKKYYSTEEAWQRRRRYYEEGPSQEWRDLYEEINAALDEDPASARAQALADRWLKLSVRAWAGDPDVQTDSGTAWMDREHWPPVMKRRLSEFNLEHVNEFLKQTALASRKKYFTDQAWAKLLQMRNNPADVTVLWQTRVDLFRDIEACCRENPAGEKAQALVIRWNSYLERASGGDPEIKSGLQKQWADRQNWPATLRWSEEGLSMMIGARFDIA
jgi:DNA-binding transcriptional MerR regulator